MAKDLKTRLDDCEKQLEVNKDWLKKEREECIKLRKLNHALLKEHKRILDLTFGE